MLHHDAHPLYDGLVNGSGRPALVVSAVAGVATLGLVWRRRFEAARYGAAVAVAAIVAGWALAQKPVFLPGLTVAAGGRLARHARRGDRRGARRRRDPLPVARRALPACCCTGRLTTRPAERGDEPPAGRPLGVIPGLMGRVAAAC